MSYLVLARKWRSNTFDEVVGQRHVTRTLKNAIELDRVAHALLFTGSRGVGKTSCARILAKALNCVNGPTTEPCGECPACVEISTGTSVDVFEIDGASNNSVEQIREIRESVKFLPTRGKRKMYIIDEVHMLSTSAFNALLKTLEEPPAHVLFVFATTEPHKIPDTIISRCQRYDFKRIPEREIVEHLSRIAGAEGIDVEQAALHHIAREARGGMRDSLSLLDQVIAFCGHTITEAQTREVLGIADRQVLHHLTAAVFRGDGQGALEIIDQLFRFGLDLQKFAAEFVQHLRDLMVVKVCADPGRLVDVADEEVAAMVELVRPVDPARIHRVFNALMQGAEEVARSPFPKLVLEMTLLRLCHQGATLPLSDVLDGLARLEARLGAPVGDGPNGQGGAPGGGASPGSGAMSGGAAGGGASARSASAPNAPASANASPPSPAVTGAAPENRGPTPRAPQNQAPAPPRPPAAGSAPAPAARARGPATTPSGPAMGPPAAKSSGPAMAPSAAKSGGPAMGPPRGGRPPANGGAPRKTFKRRPGDEGDVDDFSGPPPTPRPPSALPRLTVKPRIPGVEPGETLPEPPGESGSGAPPGLGGAGSSGETPRMAGPAAGPAASSAPMSAHGVGDFDADAVEQPEPLVARPVDPQDGEFEAYVALVEQLKAHNGLSGGRIEHDTYLVEFTHDSLVVAVLDRDREALQPDLDRLARMVRRAAGDDIALQVITCPRGDRRLDAERNAYRTRAALEAAERAARCDAARRDPIVMQLVELLDADVVDVHPN